MRTPERSGGDEERSDKKKKKTKYEEEEGRGGGRRVGGGSWPTVDNRGICHSRRGVAELLGGQRQQETEKGNERSELLGSCCVSANQFGPTDNHPVKLGNGM